MQLRTKPTHPLRRAAYLHKRLSTVVGSIAAAAEMQLQTDVTEAELAAVAARAGFSFAAPLRSQPRQAGAGGSSADMHIAGGDDEPDGAGDGDESGSDIEDLDAVLAAEEAAAAASGSDIDDLDAVLAAEEAAAAAAAEGHGSGSASGGGWQ